MTPEDYEEAGPAEAEFNPTKGEKNSQSHKTTAKLKTSASDKRDSNDHPLKGIETRLPEPQYRTVAGHVSRRANIPPAADPPPPPPPAPIRATSSNQRRGGRKKTGGGGLGDDSDDSDSGDQKTGQDNDTPSASSRRRRPLAQNDPEPTSAGVSSRPFGSLQSKPLQFSREEQERLHHRRELSIISSTWEYIMPLRNLNSKQAAKRKTQLIECSLGANGFPEDFTNQDYDKRLDEYLEKSLHRAAIEGITYSVDLVMQLTYRFIRELEKEVIRRCEGVNRGHYFNMALHHMESILVSEPVIEKTTDLNIDTWSGAVNIFAEALIDKMMRCAETGRDYLRSLPMDTLPVDADDTERTSFALHSRQRCGLTNAYMEWLCEDVDVHSIEDCPMGLLDGLRAMQRLKILREGTRQIFICQENGFYDVSLVIIKGNQPLRTQTVSPSELSQMGWFLDAHAASFWRSSLLEVAIMGGKVTRKAVFKVDMDGAVLAIQRSDGQWLDWEDIKGQRMNQESMPSKVQDS